MSNNTINIFLSHASENKRQVTRIHNAFNDKRFGNYTLHVIIIDTEYEKSDVRIGESLPQSVKDGIEQSNLFMVILTDKATKRPIAANSLIVLRME